MVETSIETDLPRVEVRPLSRDEGGGYLAEFPDYPGCMADGETPEEALAEGRDALRSYLRTREMLGRSPPAPTNPAGRRRGEKAPASLHALLATRAAREGVSLNRLVTRLLAEGLAHETAIGKP